MKILSKPKKNAKYRDTCDGCSVRVELEKADTSYRSDPRDGDAVVWKCPECKRENWVSVNVLPEGFLR